MLDIALILQRIVYDETVKANTQTFWINSEKSCKTEK